jgi:hypothetical protein
MSGGSGSVTVPTTSDVSQVRLTQSDPDFIQTWVMNNTDTESAPDLRQDFQGTTGFEPIPDYQSNYDGGYSGPRGEDDSADDYNRLIIPASDLVTSYEARVIPARTPRPKASRVDGSRDEGWETYDDTIAEWQLHLSAQSGRWKERTVNGNTRAQVLTYIENGDSDYESNANTAWDRLRDLLPYPTAAPQNVTDGPGEPNTAWTEQGGPGNTNGYDNNFILDGRSIFDQSESTAISETYSVVSGGFGTVQDSEGNVFEPNDTIFTFGSGANLIDRKAEFPLRVLYSTHSQSVIR